MKADIRTEWELMCLADDIEPGDTIVVEHLKEEKLYKLLIYTKVSDDEKWILFKDENKKEYIFNIESLEEKYKKTKQWRIIRKSAVGLRYKK
jgi:molybdopterin-guanine dinucleotide biosynthesis protein